MRLLSFMVATALKKKSNVDLSISFIVPVNFPFGKSWLGTKKVSDLDSQSRTHKDRVDAACPASQSLCQSHRCGREIPLETEVRVDVGGAAGDLKLLSFPQDNSVFLGERDHRRHLWHWVETCKSNIVITDRAD